jgi:multidrug efflux pump subunit AcrA (membrane-fusion protein)
VTVPRNVALALFALLVPPLGCGPGGGSDGTEAPPAEVRNPVPERMLTQVSLRPDAAGRLGVATEPARSGSIPQYRIYGGEAMIPVGRDITISAPLTGTVSRASPSAADEWPGPGMYVAQGRPILRLVPVLESEREVLSPADRINLARALAELETARSQAQTEMEAARTQLKAATNEVIADVLRIRIAAAEARLKVLNEVANDLALGERAALRLSAPFDGVLQFMFVGENQPVAAGEPLFQVVTLDPLWIRVPVYAGELDKLAIDADATSNLIGHSDAEFRQVVKPVPAPPSADPIAATVDLYYELSNRDRVVKPGQRLAVAIPIRGSREAILIPWRGVVHDIHGDSWVYEEVGPYTYARRRISVVRVAGDIAALSAGVTEGAAVVTDGAAELFGIEFGVGK